MKTRQEQKSIIIETLWRYVNHKQGDDSQHVIAWDDSEDIADDIISELSSLEAAIKEGDKTSQVYDEAYLNECIEKAKPNLSKIKSEEE